MSMQGSFSVRWQGITIVDAVVSYAISASNEYAPSNGWSPIVVKTTEDMPYLWTRTVTTYNDGSTNTAYSVSRQGTDGSNGTSFTPKGVALGHYKTSEAFEAEMSSLTAGNYLCDQNWKGEAVPCVIKRFGTTRSYVVAAVGDAYRIGTNMWFNSGSAWEDWGNIQGPAGEDGHNLQLIVSPTKVVLDADNEGNIVNGGYMRFIYAGKFGDEVITDNTPGAEFSISAATNDSSNFYTRFAGLYENKQATQGYFSTDGIKKFEYEVGGQKMYAPATSSFFTINLTYKGFSVSQRVDIVCNLALLNYTFVQDRHRFLSLYEELNKLQNAQGEQITSNQSAIEQTAKELDFKVSQTQYDADYQKVTDKISEIVMDADGINMRVETVENGLTHKAEISATVQKDEDGNIESGVKLNADQININASHRLDIASNGCMTINTSNFKLDEYGNVTCTNGNFSGTVNATAGTIGGFKINDSSIGSATRDGSIMGMLLSDEQIIFNSAFGQGIFGAYFLNGGYCYGSRVELNGGQNNIGLYINSKSSGIYHNFAIYAENGNAVVKGMNAGVKFSKATLEKNKWDPYAIDLLVNNVWHIECNGDNSILVLPTLGRVESALGNDKTYETFSIRITIIGYRSSTNAFTLTGRSTNTKLGYSTQEYPWLYNYDAENTSFAMSRGDVCELQLTYDGSVYYAQVLSLNR